MTYRLVTLSGTPVTLASFAAFVGAFIAFLFVARLAGSAASHRLLKRVDVDEGTRYAVGRGVQYLIVVIGFLVSFQFLGIDLGSIAILLGALGVGIGLGLQNLTSNFVSGIILLFERPIRVGDRVTVGDIEGDVIAVNMRATTVRSVRNVALIVPNSELVASTVINWSAGDARLGIAMDVGVAYDSDIDVVTGTLLEVARGHPLVLDLPEPVVRFLSFGDSSWNMRLFCWIGDAKDHFLVTSELHMATVRAFRAAGVEIPYPQRDVHFRSALPGMPNGPVEASAPAP